MTPVLVIIPCRNEGATVGRVVHNFRNVLPDARIVVVDNASCDGTADAAKSAGAMVLHEPRPGKGLALRRGLATAAPEEIALLVDGDDAFNADDARQLLSPIIEGRADLVVGSRFLGPATLPLFCRLANGCVNALAHLLFATRQTDLLSGFRALGPRFLVGASLRAEGFDIEADMSLAALRGGFRYEEAPVSVRARSCGVSKIRMFQDGLRILRQLLRYRFFRP